VGRSHHQAYAYLFTSAWTTLSDEAKKRLEAIAKADTLGVGFILASHDLEIRGSGALLGEEQSGNIKTIGFSLYRDMLEHAVKAIQTGKNVDLAAALIPQECEVELRISSLLPEDYVPDVPTRLSFYQRIAMSTSHAELDELQVELIDRFGILPLPAKHVFLSAHLSLTGNTLGIKRIEAHAGGGKIEFGEQPKVNSITLIKLIQLAPQTYQLAGQTKLIFKEKLTEASTRIAAVQSLIDKLSK
jgi:transcription-repair coupling factor (superfamily II helicase)